MRFLPEFKGPVEGYVVNFLKAGKGNLWRIARTHDFDDAMQEAFIVFMRVASKYPMVETPQHFMALFKTAWTNEFNTLSLNARGANMCVSESLADDETDKVYVADSIGELDNEGALAIMIEQAPSEVTMVLNLFLNAPQELLDMATKAWKSRGKYKANGDKAVARMLGLPEDATPMTRTKEYFTN